MKNLIAKKNLIQQKVKYMKRKIKRIQAVCIYMMLLLLLLLPQTAMAKNTEKSKTTFPVQVIHKTGDDKENFVIVIMGDGYTAGQQDQFLEDATQKARGMLSPYREYSDRINIYAVQAVSNESGIGVYGGKSPDTYFHVKVYGKAAGFTNGGDERAKALRTELEENYLDEGANVGTIHILCNDTGSYGASVNPLFSFSTNSEDNSDGMVMAHETAHSIGGLGDEYERYTNKPNMSDTTDPEKIKWSKMLGFRGIGITNAGTDTAFAPSRECMMRWLGQPFCEVCKMELARKLNNTDYVSKPAALYISDPEVSIPHNKTATLDRDSEKYRITESNVTKANDHDLEFRTVVQNMVNKEQHLKMSFRIIGADGITVKYSAEKEFTIPALTNSYDPDAARESLSVVLNDVYGLTNGDRLDGKIVDMDTQEVLATDKTADQAWSTVNIHYRLKMEDGTETDLPATKTSIVHAPRNSTYTLRNPELSGYACVGNSVDQDKITITEDSMDIVYYYQENNDSSGDEDQEIAECTTRPVTVPYDSNRHTFDIRPGEGVNLRYSMKEDGPYTIEELPAYTDAGKYTIYFEASSDSAKSCYGQASLEITKAVTELKLLATPAGSEGAGSVTLKVLKQGISADEPVDITCNDSSITLVKKENDQWTVSLPNKTKTYSFTAKYNGNKNYAGSEAACQVIVKEKKTQTGSGALEAPEGPEEPTTEKPTPQKPTPQKPAPEEPATEKPTPEKKPDKKIKNKTIRIKCKSRKGKKQVLKVSKSTLNRLIDNEAKALQLEYGNVIITMDRNALKEIKKQMNSDVYFHVKKLDKRILSSKAGKIVKKRPMYEISVTGAKKKTLGKLKKGKVTVKIHYKISKKEKKKDLFAYTINKKGNVKKISKSYYDSKKQTVNFTTKSFSKFAVGGRL